MNNNNAYYTVENYVMRCRIYPNKTQARMIDDIIHGCHAFCNMVFYDVQEKHLYTKEKKDALSGDTVHWLSISDAKKKKNLDLYRKKNSYVKLVPASALSNQKKSVLNDVAEAYTKPVEKTNHKYYSKKHPRTSYTCQETLSKVIKTDNNNVFKFKFTNIGIIKIRGWNKKIRFGADCSMNFVEFAERFPKTKIFVTIKKDNCGDYFASFIFSCEVHIRQKIKGEKKIGIDVGQTDLATTSEGIKYKNPQYAYQEKDKLCYYNRKLSRSFGWANKDFRDKYKLNKDIVPSKNYKKWRTKSSLLSRKIARKREYYQHNVSNDIVISSQFLAMESLLVKDMMNKDKLHKKRGTRKKAAKTAFGLSDAAMSQFLGMLKYKANWYNTNIVQIGKYERSTGVCPCCGHVTDKLDTSIRNWVCPQCKTENDRDYAAAMVILQKGLSLNSNL